VRSLLHCSESLKLDLFGLLFLGASSQPGEKLSLWEKQSFLEFIRALGGRFLVPGFMFANRMPGFSNPLSHHPQLLQRLQIPQLSLKWRGDDRGRNQVCLVKLDVLHNSNQILVVQDLSVVARLHQRVILRTASNLDCIAL
jgi:hypothetical protein